jgi:predicted nucleic acid-binding protein
VKAYIDSSILLRLVLGEPGRLREWRAIRLHVTSALAEVECLRTLDRLKLRGAIDAEELARSRTSIFELLSGMEVVDLSPPVLSRAASPFPTSLGTLDAIHLATALAFRDVRGVELAFATHDAQLAQAARAVGLTVIGA